MPPDVLTTANSAPGRITARASFDGGVPKSNRTADDQANLIGKPASSGTNALDHPENDMPFHVIMARATSQPARASTPSIGISGTTGTDTFSFASEPSRVPDAAPSLLQDLVGLLGSSTAAADVADQRDLPVWFAKSVADGPVVKSVLPTDSGLTSAVSGPESTSPAILSSLKMDIPSLAHGASEDGPTLPSRVGMSADIRSSSHLKPGLPTADLQSNPDRQDRGAVAMAADADSLRLQQTASTLPQQSTAVSGAELIAPAPVPRSSNNAEPDKERPEFGKSPRNSTSVDTNRFQASTGAVVPPGRLPEVPHTTNPSGAAPRSFAMGSENPADSVIGDRPEIQGLRAVDPLRADVPSIALTPFGVREGTTTYAPIPIAQLRDGITARVAELDRMAETNITTARTATGDLTTEMELAPADLGRVRLTLQTGERGLQLVVMVERPESLETVRRHLDGLHRLLLSDGVTLDSVDVGTGRRESAEDRSQPEQAPWHPPDEEPRAPDFPPTRPKEQILPFGRLDISL